MTQPALNIIYTYNIYVNIYINILYTYIILQIDKDLESYSKKHQIHPNFKPYSCTLHGRSRSFACDAWMLQPLANKNAHESSPAGTNNNAINAKQIHFDSVEFSSNIFLLDGTTGAFPTPMVDVFSWPSAWRMILRTRAARICPGEQKTRLVFWCPDLQGEGVKKNMFIYYIWYIHIHIQNIFKIE